MQITNAHLAFFLISLLISGAGIWIANTLRLIPTRSQLVVEGLISWIEEKTAFGFENSQHAKTILPLLFTIFLAIFISNQFAVFPFLSIVAGHTPIFRVPTTHFAFPLAIGLLVIILSHIVALAISPLKHISHYIKYRELFAIRSFPDFLNFLLAGFLGILEVIEEVAKIISISARLFGNIFAGEVMALVIVGISQYTHYVVPLPFYVLGIFVGLIQTVVFTLLSLQYISRTVKGVTAHH